MIAERKETNTILVTASNTPNGKAMRDWDIEVTYREAGVNGLGCHYIVHVNGDVHAGRPHGVYANHDEHFDADSVVIVVVGTNRFSEAQLVSLRGLVSWLGERYTEADELNLLEA